MFPYDRRWRWYLGGRHAHLMHALEGNLDRFAEPYRGILVTRATRMGRALKVRLGVFVLLNLGLIATGIAWVTTFVDALGHLETLVRTVASWLTALSLVFLATYLILTRYLGQLEADMIVSFVLGQADASE